MEVENQNEMLVDAAPETVITEMVPEDVVMTEEAIPEVAENSPVVNEEASVSAITPVISESTDGARIQHFRQAFRKSLQATIKHCW